MRLLKATRPQKFRQPGMAGRTMERPIIEILFRTMLGANRVVRAESQPADCTNKQLRHFLAAQAVPDWRKPSSFAHPESAPESPLPLFPPLPPAERYPAEALGPRLARIVSLTESGCAAIRCLSTPAPRANLIVGADDVIADGALFGSHEGALAARLRAIATGLTGAFA